MAPVRYDVVVPTLGRPAWPGSSRRSRRRTGPAAGRGRRGRRPARTDLPLAGARDAAPDRCCAAAGGDRRPRATSAGGSAPTPWVAFLDDDVELPPDWAAGARRRPVGPRHAGVGGSQGRLRVPLPAGRRPTDWERGTAGLEGAAWATADMAYRRAALARRRRLRRALPARLPGGRRPGAPGPTGRLGARPRASGSPAPGAPGRRTGSACGCNAATPTTC